MLNSVRFGAIHLSQLKPGLAYQSSCVDNGRVMNWVAIVQDVVGEPQLTTTEREPLTVIPGKPVLKQELKVDLYRLPPNSEMLPSSLQKGQPYRLVRIETGADLTIPLDPESKSCERLDPVNVLSEPPYKEDLFIMA